MVEFFSYYGAITGPTQFFVIWILALLSHGTLRKPRFLMFESRLWTKKVGNLSENSSISCFNFWREFNFFGAFFEKLFKLEVKQNFFNMKILHHINKIENILSGSRLKSNQKSKTRFKSHQFLLSNRKNVN